MGGVRYTEEWLAEHLRKQNSPPPEAAARAAAPKKRRAKYGNNKTIVDGKVFDSKLEAQRYQQLKLLWLAGEVLWFVRQVPFEIPGHRVYKADFVVIWASRDVTVEDAKGCDDPLSKLKRDQVEQLFRLKIELIHADDAKIGPG